MHFDHVVYNLDSKRRMCMNWQHFSQNKFENGMGYPSTPHKVQILKPKRIGLPFHAHFAPMLTKLGDHRFINTRQILIEDSELRQVLIHQIK